MVELLPLHALPLTSTLCNVGPEPAGGWGRGPLCLPGDVHGCPLSSQVLYHTALADLSILQRALIYSISEHPKGDCGGNGGNKSMVQLLICLPLIAHSASLNLPSLLELSSEATQRALVAPVFMHFQLRQKEVQKGNSCVLGPLSKHTQPVLCLSLSAF